MTLQKQASVAVVGCGYWGRNLVRNFAQLGVLASVCDLSDEGRRLAAQIAPQARIFQHYDELLFEAIPCVVIATPAETHYPLALRALEAGKDVLVEKPLALTHGEATKLVRMAERKKCILMVGHVLEYHPGVARLLALVHSGKLGKVRYIYSNRLSLGKVRREENILWSFAPHDVAVILRMIGRMPFQVVACGGSYVQPNVADVTVTHLLFDHGVRAHIYVSWLHPFKEQRLVVVGSQKMASFDDVSKKLILYDQHVHIENGEPVPVKGFGEEVAFADKEPLQLECEAFLSAVATRQPPLADGVSGLRVLKVLEAAQRSLITNGETVNVLHEVRYA